MKKNNNLGFVVLIWIWESIWFPNSETFVILQVFKTDYPLELVFSFTKTLYQLPIFEKVSMYTVYMYSKIPLLWPLESKTTLLFSLVLLNPDIPCLCKQCRSRSVGSSEASWFGSALLGIKNVNL